MAKSAKERLQELSQQEHNGEIVLENKQHTINSIFSAAVHEKDFDTARECFSKYAAQPDAEAFVPLFYAAKLGNEEGIKFLATECGANFTLPVAKGAFGLRTPLAVALDSGQLEAFKCLIELGVPYNTEIVIIAHPEAPLRTPIEYAIESAHCAKDESVKSGYRQIAKYLAVEKGAPLPQLFGFESTISELKQEIESEAATQGVIAVTLCDSVPHNSVPETDSAIVCSGAAAAASSDTE